VRELTCLLAVLQKTSRTFETLVIDGYVHLKPENGKGLGMHLYESLACVPRVVGIAKNPLKIADRFLPVLRGKSKKPLYVSAQGCPLNLAQGWVQEMHGPYRLPTLLRLTDRAARTGPDKGCV
jgi:deoxyribonuclease V